MLVERLPFIATDGRVFSITTPREPARGSTALSQLPATVFKPGRSERVVSALGSRAPTRRELQERRVPEADRRVALDSEVRARARGFARLRGKPPRVIALASAATGPCTAALLR